MAKVPTQRLRTSIVSPGLAASITPCRSEWFDPPFVVFLAWHVFAIAPASVPGTAIHIDASANVARKRLMDRGASRRCVDANVMRTGVPRNGTYCHAAQEVGPGAERRQPSVDER